MDEMLYERLVILSDNLNYFDETLHGLDDVLFSLVDAKMATEDAEILAELKGMETLIEEYDQTLLNFEEIQAALSSLFEKVKQAA